MSAFGAGAHATTFGGTPLVAAAATATLETFEKERIVENCRQTGHYFREKLEGLVVRHDCAQEVRGMGLLLGLKLDIDGGEIVNACMQRGFLVNCVQGKILRFAPPLIIDRQSIDTLIDCLDEVLGQRSGPPAQ
jgi:acetylornithine/succinyldiaminopimelate/putrescine aminotransferase